ncbi:hypothetical protein ES703_94200 [subsurface metagenome]
MLPEHVGDVCAGFAISPVGQQVRVSESLVVVLGGSYAPVDVHLATHHVLPDAIQGTLVVGGVHETGDIGHRRIYVPGADGVADGVLLDERLVVLHASVAYAVSSPAPCSASLRGRQIIKIGRFGRHGFGVEGLTLEAVGVASLVKKEPRQFQVPPLTGGAVEFDQGQLHLFVPPHIVPLAGPEDIVDVVGKSLRCVQHVGLAGQPIMLDGHLEKVAGIVQLVLQA